MVPSVELMLPPNFSSTGLAFPVGMTFEQWASYGPLLQQIAIGGQWWYGDWINEGERRYGEKYSQAIEVSGLPIKTLQVYAYVCRSVESLRRRKLVDFSHHREVASLPPPMQTKFLRLSEKENWTVKKLRDAIKAHQTVDEREPEPELLEPQQTAEVVDPKLAIQDAVEVIRNLTGDSDEIEELIDRAIESASTPALLGDDPISRGKSVSKSITRLINDLLREIKGVPNDCVGCGLLARNRSRMLLDIDNVKVAIASSTPHSVCPYCLGVPVECPVCEDRGWVNKMQFNNAPVEKRHAAERLSGGGCF